MLFRSMSSVLAFKPFNCLGGFGASVAALTAFNDSLRQELEPHNIRVAIIHPGLTQTPVLQNYELPKQFKRFTPLTPEYVAKKILHIASRKRFRVILPFHAHYLLVGSTISVKLGDFMVKMLQNRFFTRVIGIYRGKTYESK